MIKKQSAAGTDNEMTDAQMPAMMVCFIRSNVKAQPTAKNAAF
jgi:hypothetical protein